MTPLPSHCQPRWSWGTPARSSSPAAPQPHPHWAARPAEASGGRTETTGRHWANQGERPAGRRPAEGPQVLEQWARVDAGLPEARRTDPDPPRCVLIPLVGVELLKQAVPLSSPSSDALRGWQRRSSGQMPCTQTSMPLAPSWSLHWAYRDGHLWPTPPGRACWRKETS